MTQVTPVLGLTERASWAMELSKEPLNFSRMTRLNSLISNPWLTMRMCSFSSCDSDWVRPFAKDDGDAVVEDDDSGTTCVADVDPQEVGELLGDRSIKLDVSVKAPPCVFF